MLYVKCKTIHKEARYVSFNYKRRTEVLYIYQRLIPHISSFIPR